MRRRFLRAIPALLVHAVGALVCCLGMAFVFAAVATVEAWRGDA